MADNKKQLVFSILDFLQKSCQDGTVKPDDVEGLEVAMQCIGEAFGVDPEDPSQQAEYSIKPASLQSIFDVFVKTQKSRQAGSSKATGAAKAQEASEDQKKNAEELKAAGNRKVAERNYDEAIKLYSQAIELDGKNAVYYANRAAAYSGKGDHSAAVADALKSSEVDPKYSKAYSRLGHAQYSLGRYEDAVNAYKKGLELEPDNATMKSSLATAQNKLKEGGATSPSDDITSADASRNANSGAGGAGGMPGLGGMDFASLLNNPAMMSMAQQMMQSGALDTFMNNPRMREMAQNMMSGGGMPSMSELMNDPQLREMARQFGAGQGGNNPPSDQ